MKTFTKMVCLWGMAFGLGLAITAPIRAETLDKEGDAALAAAIRYGLPKDVQPDRVDILKTVWNDASVAFVDYPVVNGTGDDATTDVQLKVFVPAGGSYKPVDIDVLEDEGGKAQVRAIAFANADKDAAKELVVIIAWDVEHYDVGGTMYEVRIFDDLGAVKDGALPNLTSVSKHFGEGCDCNYRDQKPSHYHFKTAEAVKKELLRMGY